MSQPLDRLDVPPGRTLPLPDQAATAALATRLAAASRPGDLIALAGDLGAGKTAFARSFVHARQDAAGLPRDEVPSPTFTLVQVYEVGAVPIWHFDLYRLASADEVSELGFEEALATGISLVEWPDRLGALLPADRLDLLLEAGAEEDARIAVLRGAGEAGRRLEAAA